MAILTCPAGHRFETVSAGPEVCPICGIDVDDMNDRTLAQSGAGAPPGELTLVQSRAGLPPTEPTLAQFQASASPTDLTLAHPSESPPPTDATLALDTAAPGDSASATLGSGAYDD